jgi:predicted dehydrogenase
VSAPLRVGLIGAGNNMLSTHVPRYLNRPEAMIAACTEPFAANVARIKERFPDLSKIPFYDDHQKMLAEAKLDAVVISTPHAYHYQQIVDALGAGCHVLCEKPLVCSVQEAKGVIAARDKAKKIVLVSYQRHYLHAFLVMKTAIDNGLVGSLQYVDLQQNQNWYNNQKTANRWRIQKDLSGGGQLNDSGSHIVDILLYVTGLEPEKVYAVQQSFDLGVDVNSAVTVTFKGGATGCLSIVGNAPFKGGSVHEDITIYGSEGAVFYRQLGQESPRTPFIEVRRFDSETPVEVTGVPEPSNPDENFLAAIAGKEPVLSPAECGLRVMQLSEAAWKSAERGEAVAVSTL